MLSKLLPALLCGLSLAAQTPSPVEDALKTAERYAQDADEANNTHDLEDVETALAPFAAMM